MAFTIYSSTMDPSWVCHDTVFPWYFHSINHIFKPSHNRHDEKSREPAQLRFRSLGSDAQQRVSLCDLLQQKPQVSLGPRLACCK